MKKYFTIFMLSLTATAALAQTSQTVRYEYDALNRLTRAAYPNSVTVTYNYDVLGNRTSVVTSSQGCQTPTATLSGTQTVAAGQIATLNVELTGTAPHSLTLSSGQTYSASTSPFTFTVSPATTTTYTLGAVSNSCGIGTVSGSAIVTVAATGSCSAMYSVKTGDWNDATVWSCNRIPLSTDVVQISANHIVTIPAGVTAYAQRVQDYNRLVFGADARLRLGLAETTPPVDLTTGLMAFYSFDGHVNDGSGNNRNGTANGGLTFTTDRTDTANKAASFDGVDDWVDTPYSQSNLTEFTVSVWFKTDLGTVGATNPSAIIQNRNTGAGNSITLDYDRTEGGWNFGIDGDYTRICQRATYTNPNAWRHLAGVWKGAGSSVGSGQFNVYINGVLQSTIAVDAGSASIPFSASGTVKIAYHQLWNTYFKGSLDDLRIYNRALAGAEVQALANQ